VLAAAGRKHYLCIYHGHRLVVDLRHRRKLANAGSARTSGRPNVGAPTATPPIRDRPLDPAPAHLVPHGPESRAGGTDRHTVALIDVAVSIVASPRDRSTRLRMAGGRCVDRS
jgi:hypothetical protein